MNYPENIIVYPSLLKSGKISIAGYKHAAVPIISASLILPQSIVNLYNVPNIADTVILSKIIHTLGGFAVFEGNKLSIRTESIYNHIVPSDLSQQIHGALYLLPTLLARLGKVVLGGCGGCQIGNSISPGGSSRPIDHMISVLSQFGCKFSLDRDCITGSSKGFQSCVVNILDYSDNKETINGPLVSGATKTAILAALAVEKGTTEIINPYLKPDVTELLEFIKLVGYRAELKGNTLYISKNTICYELNYTLMSDISEIMTYLTCALYHKIPSLTLDNINTEKVLKGLAPELEYLHGMGIKINWQNDQLQICGNQEIKACDIIVTSTGIFSDHQPLFALLLSLADDFSKIIEKVWHKRFSYAEELKKMGLNVQINNNVLIIQPSLPNIGKQCLRVADLRAAAVLIISALKAPHYTIINNINHLYRGYVNFIGELKKLGAAIEPHVETILLS